MSKYLACDLGADSGRLICGTLDQNRLMLEELHRFPNTPIKTGGSLHWDIERLFSELINGLVKAGRLNQTFAGISCDSWGVDYILYNQDGKIMPPVFHYRDQRCVEGVKRVKAKVPWETVFAETGIQFMQLNSIYQLAMESQERLKEARMLLCIGDAFNYFLSGTAKCEESLASTTQLYNPKTRSWSKALLAALQLPETIFPAIIPSGTRLGNLKGDISKQTGLRQLNVIASCSHDTGAAVAAVPGEGDDWAYISSGTWSLMGVELPHPVVTDQCRELNFTNEVGFGGSIRLLKNISGLWLIQECKREWAKAGQSFDFATLEKLARDSAPFVSLVNPADPRFIAPDQMPEKIAQFCRETGQPAPSTPGAVTRCVYESLALLYRRTLQQLQRLTARSIAKMHIVGGGSKDALLNQFTANALQIPVLAGPAEATATGNIIVQAISLGDLPSLSAARQLIRNSFEIKSFLPQEAKAWDHAYERFGKLVG